MSPNRMIWKTMDGREVKVCDMKTSHILNALRWLKARCSHELAVMLRHPDARRWPDAAKWDWFDVCLQKNQLGVQLFDELERRGYGGRVCDGSWERTYVYEKYESVESRPDGQLIVVSSQAVAAYDFKLKRKEQPIHGRLQSKVGRDSKVAEAARNPNGKKKRRVAQRPKSVGLLERRRVAKLPSHLARLSRARKAKVR